MSPDDRSLFQAWSSALFDKSSEGIEDNLLRYQSLVPCRIESCSRLCRSTKPEKLLCFAPSLFAHAMAATLARTMDVDVLKSGVSYFLGGLLNWTLVGVLNSLITDINRAGYVTAISLT